MRKIRLKTAERGALIPRDKVREAVAAAYAKKIDPSQNKGIVIKITPVAPSKLKLAKAR